MADIRCSVCDRTNPEELENCQYCGSRLRTKSGKLSGGTEPLPPIHVGDAPIKKGTAELERTLPKWLRDIRGGKDPNAEVNEPAEQPKALKPDEPELKRVFSTEPTRVSLRPMRKTGELRSKTGELKSKTGELKSKSEEIKSQLPPQADFLAGLSSAKSGEDEEVPDWLASIQKKAERSTQPLSRPTIPGAAPVSGASPQDLPIASDPEYKSPFSYTPPPGEDSWSIQPGELEAPAAAAPTPETPATGVDDVSEWLRGLDQQQAASDALRPAPASPFSSSGDVPVWLQTPDQPKVPAPPPAPAEAQPAETTPGSDEPSFDETPDWLADMIAEMPSSTTGGLTNQPDWLKALGDESITGDPASASPPAAPASDGAPSWMSPPPAAAAPPPAIPEQTVEDESKDSKPFDTGSLNWLKDEIGGVDSDLPSWLSAMPNLDQADAAPAPPTPAESVQDKSGPQAAERQPDSSSSLPRMQPPEPSALIMNQQDIGGGRPDALFSTEMPDWLSGMAPAEQQKPAAFAGSDSDLSPTELPSWVQAMRPVESAMPEGPASALEERGAELEGPLAGIRDVLPARPGLDMPRKPVAFSSKISMNESQQNNAALLENLLAAETLPGALRSPARTPAPWLRWAIGAALVLAAAIAVVLGSEGVTLVPVDLIAPPELTAASKIFSGLQPNSAVLMVFDYEPGFSGEMESVAAPVLGQLMLQGERIALLSTSPTGALLAERLIATQQGDRHYQPDQQYVDLGYLAGGTAGISGFTANPAGTLRLSATGVDAWQTPVLAGVQKLSDFSAVVIVTDNAENGRAWVEQTHADARLGAAPFLMVISAQAEPMIRPYYESGQVQGLVTGLVGGAAYEKFSGLPGPGHTYWDAFSFAFLVAEAAIVIGGVLSLLAAWRARRPDMAAAEDEV